MSRDKVLRRCEAMTRRGEPCRGRVMKERDDCVARRQTPPPTPPHSGEGSQGGEESQGREESGEGTVRPLVVFQAQPVKELETIEDVIEDMLQRQSQLTTLIEEKTLAEPL